MTRLEVMDKAIELVGYLEDALNDQTVACQGELNTKVGLEVAKAFEEEELIVTGLITGKTVGDRDRQMLLQLEGNKNYQHHMTKWIAACNAHRNATVRVEVLRLQIDLYKAYLGGNND